MWASIFYVGATFALALMLALDSNAGDPLGYDSSPSAAVTLFAILGLVLLLFAAVNTAYGFHLAALRKTHDLEVQAAQLDALEKIAGANTSETHGY